MGAELTIRPYRPGDEEGIVAGWNAIFPGQDRLEPRDVGYWRWEFAEGPLRRVEIVVAEVGSRIVGQYACIPLPAIDEGREVTVGLVADAYVLPDYRRCGGRPGLIVHLARKLHELYCGPRAKERSPGHTLLYGYPFPIFRIAQRYLGSEIVRDMDVLFRELAAPPLASPEGVRVEAIDRPGPEIDELWARCRGEVGFGLVRDRAFFTWRYALHPRHRYELLAVRGAGDTIRGLAVYRRGRYVVEDAGIVCDWLVPRADREAEDALLAEIDHRQRRDRVPVVVAVFPQNAPQFLSWQRRGYLVGPPSHFLVMNTFVHHVRYLRDRWYFTLGDSDLV